MKEEKLIKKLESVKLPEIELQSHRRRLRTALLNAGYLQRQREVAILELAKSKVKGGIDTMIRGLVSRQPVWKTAVVSILALALVIGLSLTIPSLSTKSVYAQAAEIAQNSPQVQAALGGGEVQEVKVKVVGDKGTVTLVGETGLVTAEVDMKSKKVTVTHIAREWTEAEKQKAIDIAKADPRVQELLNKGASIANEVASMYSFETRMNAETGKMEEITEELVGVEITLGETTWLAEVDLANGKVVRLGEMTPGGTESSNDGGTEKSFHTESE
jgi:hypothetical protein